MGRTLLFVQETAGLVNMPHVALVTLSGLRVRQERLADLGSSLPGLQRRAAAVTELPSLGLLTLAGMLPPDWSCSYHSVERANDVLLQTVVSEKPTLVAISALTASVQEAYSFAKKLRDENILSVLGGLHATSCPDEAAIHVDAVVRGEGELIWSKLLDDVTHGRLQPVYEAVRTAEVLPWAVPRFDLLPPSNHSRWTLQTQRGCPLACDFCAASRLLSRFREKPAEVVQRELQAITSLDRRPVIELADDNTFAGERDPTPLLEVLAGANARWFTEADWRIGERPELLTRLAQSGCVQVLVGVESLTFRYPGMGEKADALQRIMRAIDAIQAAGIAVNGCFVAGADGETRQSLDRLSRFIQSSQLADVQVTLQTPFPGTGLRTRLDREGRLLSDRDWSHYTLVDLTFQPDQMTVLEMESAFLELLSEIHGSAEAQRREAIRKQIWNNNRAMRGGT